MATARYQNMYYEEDSFVNRSKKTEFGQKL